MEGRLLLAYALMALIALAAAAARAMKGSISLLQSMNAEQGGLGEHPLPPAPPYGNLFGKLEERRRIDTRVGPRGHTPLPAIAIAAPPRSSGLDGKEP